MPEWKTSDPIDLIRTDRAHVIEYGFSATELGRVTVAWTASRVCWFALDADRDVKQALAVHWKPLRLERNDQLAAEYATALLENPERFPLLLRGTPWQLQIWQALRTIPAGQTSSYADLAQRAAGNRKAARAAGSAVGANRIAIAVPCHRVLPASGALGGFRWGAPLKRRLLAGELARIGDQRGRAA